MELDYKRDLQIDKHRLDTEWLDQANVFMRYAEELAQAERELRRAHERVKLTKAQLINDANKDSDSTLGDGVKPTATNVEAYYRTHTDYLTDKNTMSDREYERDILYNAVSAFRMRKDALQDLVRLHGQSYFATPAIRDNEGVERVALARDERTNTVNKKINNSLNASKTKTKTKRRKK